MTPITEQGLLDIGFESCRRNGELDNSHVYDFQVTGENFYVKRYKQKFTDAFGKEVVRQDDKFIVEFHSYYNEQQFSGFEYIEQIQSLIKALHPHV